MRQISVLGPPGCGKTAALTNEVRDMLQSGAYTPGSICYTSFTRAAAETARDRILSTLNSEYDRDDFRSYGTIHSICGRLLHFDWGDKLLNDRTLRGQSLLRTFGKEEGFEFQFGGDYDEESDLRAGVGAEGNLLLGWYNWLRQCMHSIDEGIERWGRQTRSGLRPVRQREFAAAYEEFKRRAGVRDFTDVLLLADARRVQPGAEVLIIDEAQDLSPLQWSILDRWRRAARLVYLGGDDDQAIYDWQGADAELFLTRINDGELYRLEQSYRMPRSSHQVSQWLVRRIQQRIDKPFRPREHEGHVEDCWLQSVPLTRPGNWFILARNTYLLQGVRNLLEEQAIPYRARRGFNPEQHYYGLARAITALARGRLADRDDVIAMARKLRPGAAVSHALLADLSRGRRSCIPDVVRFEDLAGLGLQPDFLRRLQGHPYPVELLEPELLKARPWKYLRALQRRCGDAVFDERPAIELGTIHSVKGDEADHVVLLTDMAAASRESLERAPDGEHRVWYVGVSRARDSLYLVTPATATCYTPLAEGSWRLAGHAAAS